MRIANAKWERVTNAGEDARHGYSVSVGVSHRRARKLRDEDGVLYWPSAKARWAVMVRIQHLVEVAPHCIA